MGDMNPLSRRLMIQRLIPAIGMIGPEFEAFCGAFLNHVLTTPLEHSGINSLGFPVSQVLDSTSDDGALVAQYSAEKDYFSAGMPKAAADVDKALARRPGAKRILLISNEPTRLINADNFKKALLSQSRMTGRSIRIWGANQIAAWIVRKLLFNDAAADELSAYLPELAQIRDEAARDRLFLAVQPRHRPRPELDAEIARRLGTCPCLILSGIGGCGKSEAASAYGASPTIPYALKIWLDRDEFTDAAGLLATPLVRGGDKRNIGSLLKSGHCLLVIDDPRGEIVKEDLTALCGPGSHILVTVRDRRPGDYEIPQLLQPEARDILNASVVQQCPRDIFETIWATVGGHPLSMALMNAAVRANTPWDDIADDCEAIGRLPDQTQRLADRILARCRNLLSDELSLFEWAGKPECDIGFLRYAIKPVGIRNLKERALSAADLPASLRLHDVVFASLRSLDWWKPARRAELDNLLAAYLEKAAAAEDLSLWATATSLRARLQALVDAGDRRPAFLLALLTVTQPDGLAPLDLEHPSVAISALAAAGKAVSAIEFRLAVESFEWLYRRAKQSSQQDGAAFAQTGLGLFDALAGLTGLTVRQRAEIDHHRGKALAWLRRHSDARAAFERVMASEYPLPATCLQLIRAYKADRAFAEATALGSSVLDAAEDEGSVAPSVLLAVMQDMPWQREETRRTVLMPRSALIERTVMQYANAGYDQAYKTLAAVARYWSREAPVVLARVLGGIPRPMIEQIQEDEVRSAFGDILLEYSRIQGVDGAPIREAALSFFEATRNPKPFHLQRKAELLIEMGRPSDAETILRSLEANCWVQRLLASARLDQGNPTEALSWIDLALADPKGESRYYEFREARYEICKALDIAEAIDDLRLAYQLSPKGPLRDRLGAILASELDATAT